MRSNPRTAWALALSLLLHLALFAYLATRPPPEPRAVPEAPGTIITFDLQETPVAAEPAPKPEPEPEPDPVHKQKRTQAGERKLQQSERAQQLEPAPAPPAAGAELAEDVPRSGSGQSAGPRLKSLVPDSPRIAGSDEGFAAGPVSRGTTIVNDGSAPSRGQTAELQALQAQELIDGWIVEDKAALRVANGQVDDYFREMKHALEKGASKPPKDAAPEGSVARQLFNGYRDQLQRFGATGSPVGLTGEDLPARDATSAMAREVQRDAALAEGVKVDQQMAQLRNLANSLGGRLMAIVEIRQGRDGAFVDAKLVTPSGNDLFDSFVLATAPSSISLLPPLPPHVAETHPGGVKSLWSFEGLLEYRKKAGELKADTAGDKAYLAAMGLLSLVTGAPFEETSGDLYLMDLRDPKFRCKAKLLKLY